MTDLLPCPFCGSPEVKYCRGLGGTHVVECQKCETTGPRARVADNAMTIWNIRAGEVEVRKQLVSKQWQPIDTAPKDGTTVLLFGQWAGEVNGIDPGGPDIHLGHWDGRRGDYDGFLWSVESTDAYAAWVNPTHWMPLPASPLTDELREGEK